MSQYLPHFPTDRIRILFVETELQLRSLSDAVAPSAARHPGQPAPSGIVAHARRLLDAIARIVAREKRWRGQLLLVEAPSWAELGAKLALAAAALRRFSALYLNPPISMRRKTKTNRHPSIRPITARPAIATRAAFGAPAVGRTSPLGIARPEQMRSAAI